MLLPFPEYQLILRGLTEMSYKAANETYFEQAREIPCSFNFGIAFSYSLIWLYSLGIKIPSYGFLLLHHRRAFCHCPFFMDRCTPKGAFDKLSHNGPSVICTVSFTGYIIAYEIFRVKAKYATNSIGDGY